MQLLNLIIGELRFFLFLGVFIGLIIYMIAFSKIFISLNVKIIQVIKKVVYIVIIKPIGYIIRFLKNILRKPIYFVFVNTRRMLSKIKLKPLKFHKNDKNKDFQKDLI